MKAGNINRFYFEPSNDRPVAPYIARLLVHLRCTGKTWMFVTQKLPGGFGDFGSSFWMFLPVFLPVCFPFLGGCLYYRFLLASSKGF